MSMELLAGGQVRVSRFMQMIQDVEAHLVFCWEGHIDSLFPNQIHVLNGTTPAWPTSFMSPSPAHDDESFQHLVLLLLSGMKSQSSLLCCDFSVVE